MALSSDRWKVISPSEYQWERDALDYIRENLPDSDSYRAWTNFEFISDDGSINEVDLLIVTPCGFFLIEIKSFPGSLTGEAMTWVWKTDRGIKTIDNPLLLANRKAKKLVKLLQRQKGAQKIRVPFIEPLVFCSSSHLHFHLSGHAANHICLHERNSYSAGRKILDALRKGEYPGSPQYRQTAIDRPTIRDLSKAIEQAGIRPSQRSRRVGDWLLGELLYESQNGAYQDWDATHPKIEGFKRRIRIYNIARTTSELDREYIRRAAHREVQLLEGIEHPGILKILDFTEHELGPALIFQNYHDAVRLDHYLAREGEKLNFDRRLNLVRQIAETLRHAHGKRLVHRALSPQSILLTDAESESPQVKIFNWQSGFRLASGATREALRLAPTSHLEQLVEDASMVYLAPEAVNDPEASGERLDIFSLGGIAFHLFSGQPPAANPAALREKIRASEGLRLSSVMDAVVNALEELVQFATLPDSSMRWNAVEFLAQLEKVEAEMTEPAPDYIANPLDAKVGDRLEGGFVVRSRLGKGSSATAFVVEKDGREAVLKLANDSDHNDVILEEAYVLKNLRSPGHPTIIEFYETAQISGLAGFTMRKVVTNASNETQTLAQFLRLERPLSTELLRGFGEDLLEAVKYLERQGVAHRDIKPDNIVVGRIGADDRLNLVLFDFSLSKAPVNKLRAGTAHYLDPFLEDRKRWDLHAERFAAAVTLYEMATGELPVWGDGHSDPALIKCEATLKTESFDPALRDQLAAFFERAFRRDARQRFDAPEEMLRAWRNVFEAARQAEPASTDETSIDLAALANATPATEIFLLGLSVRAERALAKLGVVTVEDLLAVSLRRLDRMPNVGAKTQREIRRVVAELRKRFPEIEPATDSATASNGESQEAEPAAVSIDLIAPQVTRVGPPGKKEAERTILFAFLGLDASGNPTAGALDWPSQSEVAERLGLTRARVGQVVMSARQRWRRNPSITDLRKTVEQILESRGGAMTLGELCEAALNARGSVSLEPRRSQQASLVVRAALEAERGGETPRFFERRLTNGRILITRIPEMAAYVERLARAADEISGLDPLLNPARAVERLREAPPPEAPPSPETPSPLPPFLLLDDARLVQLAVAASTRAALSAKGEIYPRGMDALRALRLSNGAWNAVYELTVEELRHRVQSRYPLSEPLPDPPAPDDLLREAGIDLIWNQEANKGDGAYVWRQKTETGRPSSTLSKATSARPSTNDVELHPEIADARILDNKLRRASAEGSFLALTVAPRRLRAAEKALLKRFDLDRRNLDEIFLRVMREQAARLKVDWQVVLKADAAPADSQDWRNLMILVSRCAPIIEEELSRSDKTLLLVYPGLLKRYRRLDLLERLRERAVTPGNELHGVWALIASDEQSALPKLDGVPVPVISSNQWASLTDRWIEGV